MKAKEILGMLIKKEKQNDIGISVVTLDTNSNFSHIHEGEEIPENEAVYIRITSDYIKMMDAELGEIKRGN